jgi:5-methylcytosine-specific restriction endonuclease McrA
MTKRQQNWQGMNWIRQAKRFAIYERDGLACVYCGGTAEDTTLTLDHIVAVELGGTNHETNLVTCCRNCNSAKGKKSTRQFLNFLRDSDKDTVGLARRIKHLTTKPINYGRKRTND